MINRSFIGALGIYTIGGLFWAFLPFFVGLNISSGGFSQAQAGALGTGYLAGFSAASLTALWWARRFNWRALSLIAAGAVVTALLALARVGNYPASLAAVVAIGLMMGALWTIAYRIFSASGNPERSFAVGIVVSYSVLALVSYVVGRFLVEQHGLAGSSYFLGALILVLALSALLLPAGGAAADEGQGEALERPSLPLVLALLGILGTGFAFAAVWAFAERIGVGAGYDASEISPVIASNLLASALGSVVATLLGMRAGRLIPLLAGMLAMLVSMLALMQLADFRIYAIAVAGLGFAIGFVLPYQMGNIAALDSKSQFVVLIAAAQGIGSALGPWLGGAAADAGGYRLLILVAAAVLVLSAIMILATLRSGAGGGGPPAAEARA